MHRIFLIICSVLASHLAPQGVAGSRPSVPAPASTFNWQIQEEVAGWRASYALPRSYLLEKSRLTLARELELFQLLEELLPEGRWHYTLQVLIEEVHRVSDLSGWGKRYPGYHDTLHSLDVAYGAVRLATTAYPEQLTPYQILTITVAGLLHDLRDARITFPERLNPGGIRFAPAVVSETLQYLESPDSSLIQDALVYMGLEWHEVKELIRATDFPYAQKEGPGPEVDLASILRLADVLACPLMISLGMAPEGHWMIRIAALHWEMGGELGTTAKFIASNGTFFAGMLPPGDRHHVCPGVPQKVAEKMSKVLFGGPFFPAIGGEDERGGETRLAKAMRRLAEEDPRLVASLRETLHRYGELAAELLRQRPRLYEPVPLKR